MYADIGYLMVIECSIRKHNIKRQYDNQINFIITRKVLSRSNEIKRPKRRITAGQKSDYEYNPLGENPFTL